MKIAFAIPGDITTPTGGYNYDRRILAGLRAMGHDVSHLALGDGFPDPGEDDVLRAIAALAEAEADVLLVDGLAFGALPLEGLRRVATPMVALVHHPLALETGLSEEAAERHRRIEAAALTAAAGVIVTSPTTRDTLLADYGVPAEAVTVAVPGLDPQWNQRRAEITPPLIVSVGSIISRKGHDSLLYALREIKDIPWRAVIVGSKAWDAPLVAQLERIADPIADRIELPGALSEDDIRSLYAKASVFTLATRYEGFGMVFLEAMAAGLPVVATRGGAVPSVVPADAGLLVAVDDVPALAAALRTVLTDPATASRLAAGARRAAAAAARWEDSAALVADRLSDAAVGT